MAASPVRDEAPVRSHGFHEVSVRRVVHETEAARSFVLDIPAELAPTFAYRAGQFVTLRVVVDGSPQLRCYSMSSVAELDAEMAVTVKRVPGGVVSNWLIDHVEAGDTIEVTGPAGSFQLTDSTGPLVAFAAGSGITPIISLVRSALAGSDRQVHLLYANQDLASTIFSARLVQLEQDSNGRLLVERRTDDAEGLLDDVGVRSFVSGVDPGAEFYLCGPTPFMDVVESGLSDLGIDRAHIHAERFASPPTSIPDDTTTPEDTADATDNLSSTMVTIDVDGRSGSVEHQPGTTVLQTARQLGLDPPYSCESGSCATCMARVVDGSVTMHVNDALTEAEVAEGWVLTCQSVPTSSTLHVVYGYD